MLLNGQKHEPNAKKYLPGKKHDKLTEKPNQTTTGI